MTHKPKLILLEIGQSPQPEMESEFRRVLGDRCDIQTLGALDHMSESEIAQCTPKSDADTLVTGFPDGRSLLVSKRSVVIGLQLLIGELKDLNASVSILCCSGKFPDIQSTEVHMAYDILAGAILDRVATGLTLGVFVPDQAQVEHATEDWKTGAIR